MTNRKLTARLNAEPLETREMPSAPPWNLALGYNDHGLGRIKFLRGPSAFQTATFETGDTLFYDPLGNYPSQEVRVAVADVNHDGTPDVIAANGPRASWRTTPTIHSKAQVRVFDGATIASSSPFNPNPGPPRVIAAFTLPWKDGGSFLAAGDLDGDGYAEVVAGRDISDDGWGPPQAPNQVAVYSGQVLSNLAYGAKPAPMAVFSGITDPSWHGGTTVGVGDVSGDGRPEVVVGVAHGGGPRAAVWNGTSVGPGLKPRKVCSDFFAGNPESRSGIAVAVADLNQDGYSEVLAGSLTWWVAPEICDGRTLATGGVPTVHGFPNIPHIPNAIHGHGCRPAVRDLDGDKMPDLAIGLIDTGDILLLKKIEFSTPDYFTRSADHYDPFNGLLNGPNTGGVWVG